MKRIIISVIISLAFSVAQSKVIMSVDTVRLADTDSIQNREDSTRGHVSDPLGPIYPPINIEGDTYSNPIVIGTITDDFTFSELLSTTDFTNKYTAGRSTNDIYYKFILTVPMNVTMTHEGSWLDDTYMSLLDSLGNLIESNNDYSGDGHCSNIHHSFIQRQLAAGTYYVVSEGYSYEGYICTNVTGFASNNYGYPSVPSAYSTDSDKGVGNMDGAFSVSAMGGATYSIPLDVPLGVCGLQPQLSIAYNSQAGNGLCGYGASLSGISSITRGPKDIYHDGSASGITYLANDALYLDGVRLILDDNSTAGQDGAIYYPESNPFTRVIEHGTCTSSSNSIWFEVQGSDGMKYRYGFDSIPNTNSKLSYTDGCGAQKIHSWYLSYALQPTGNYINYSYQIENNCVYPSRITYGNNISQNNSLANVIEFSYVSRDDVIPIRFDGQQGSMAKRLATVTGKTNDSIYRSYTLTYNNVSDATSFKYSRLVSVTERNKYGQQLPSTKLNWSYLPSISYSSDNLTVNDPANINPFASFPFSGQYYMSGDMNGDGLTDIIGMANVGEPNNNGGYNYCTYVYTYYASLTSTGAVEYVSGHNDVLPPYIDSKLIKAGVNNLSVIDLDGNGINELVVPYFSQSGNYGDLCVFVLGQDFSTGDGVIKSLYSNTKPAFATGDIDNDGRSEVLFIETTQRNGAYPFYIWNYNTDFNSGNNNQTEHVFEMDTETSLSLTSQPKSMYVVDMNGNGLQDLFVICENGYSIYWNQGLGVSGYTYTDSYKTTGSNVKDARSLTPGDFNGDGLLDLLSNTKGSVNWYFFINNGNGTFSSSLVLDVNVLADQSNTTLDDDMIFCKGLDLDADGKTDVVISKAVYASNTFDYVITKWFNSTGSTLVQKYSSTSKRLADIDAGKYFIGDFDGDGHMDLVNYGYDCRNSADYNGASAWRIYKNSNLTAQSGKVTSITDPLDVTTGITYSTLTNPSVYTRGSADVYPAPKYTLPLNVVREIVQGNGAAGDMIITYSYSGLKVHLQGKGLLGFSSTTATNATLETSTLTSINGWNSTFFIPSSIKVKTYVGSNYDHSETTTTISVTDKGQKKYFAFPSRIVEKDIDGNIVTTDRSYNTTYGYLNSEVSTYSENMYRSVTYSDYTLAGGAYRPQTVVSSQQHPDDSSPFTYTTVYEYDSNTGLVVSKIENYGTSKPLTTEYGYDLWGNMISSQNSGSGITSCVNNYSYDVTHRFPVRIYTNPSSSVMKYTYDLWGKVLTRQDSINTSITNTYTYRYDGWGNLTRTQIPGGGEITYTRGWNNSSGKRYFILAQGTNRPWVKTWYDNRGREVQTETVGPDNVSEIRTTSFNNKGQVTSRTDTEGDLALTYNYTYDSRGRIRNESYPGGGSKTYTYGTNNGLRIVTVTENKDFGTQNTTYRYDQMNNLKKVEGPESSVIENTYASNGGIKTTLSNGATWTFQYDERGNRTSMTDPDADTTTYVYDALGRETRRTDARKIANITNYDYLGRVTSSASVTYTYGTSSTDQMRLKSRSYGGWTETYDYDTYGHVTHETMSNGTTITRHKYYTYDSNGQLTGKTLPGNKTYSYTYDAYGNLTGVSGAGGAVQWSLQGYTGKRTVSHTVLNGTTSYPFVKTQLLDQYGYLDSIKVVQHDNWWYQDDDYSFSPVTGNLMTVNNRMSDGEVWSFVYDNADRLTKIRENNQDIMVMAYAANGNITGKTGTGSYTYGNTTHPHQVTGVSNTDGSIILQVQDITYNNWNKVSSVWAYDDDDFYSYSIEYGPNRQRVRSQYSKTYQNQYDKFYWDDYEEKVIGTDTLHYYYVYGADGLAGLHIVKTGPNIQTTTHTTKVITDHLGSIVSLIDNSDYVYDVQYDVWGGREVMLSYDFDPTFDRGYTGHEHLDVLNLINMNGRMYDPQLGRFLSPDPFIQSPTDPQNYNRYSYCLNNPLKYTDPSGEKISWLWGLAIALNIIPIESVMAGITVATTDAITSGTVGLIDGGIDEAAKRATNSIKLATGLLQSDETDGGEFLQFARSYFRSVWCSPSSLLGYAYSCNANLFDRVDVDTYYGATVIRSNWSSAGVTMGHYIMINPKYTKTEFKSMLIHEYGHFMQSRSWGGFSALSGGVYSLVSAINGGYINGVEHENLWIERDASARGAEHLSEVLDNDITVRNYYDIQYPQQYYDMRMLHNSFIPFSVGFGIYNIFNPN